MRPPGRWMASIFCTVLEGVDRHHEGQRRGQAFGRASGQELRRTRSFATSSRASIAPSAPSSRIASGRSRPVFPPTRVDDILALPFEAPSLEGVSGKRELHNNTRKYFDVDNRKQFPVCEAVAQAFQDKRVTSHIEKVFGTNLDGTYLRMEFAQDIDGFWLEPHSDLGVKVFTMLLYLSKDPNHRDLGTDIYDANKKPVGRSPFAPNAAMIFVPRTIPSRLREASDQGRAHVADHQLRHR